MVATCLRLPRTETGGRLDLPGAAALAGTATCLLLVCQWDGQRYPWLSPPVLAVAVAGLVLGAAFGYRQTHSPAPFFPPRLLRHRTLRAISAVQLATGCGMAAATVYVTLDLQLVRHISAARTGVLLLPMAVGLALGSAGRLADPGPGPFGPAVHPAPHHAGRRGPGWPGSTSTGTPIAVLLALLMELGLGVGSASATR